MGTRHDLEHRSAIPFCLAVFTHLIMTTFLAPLEDDGQHLGQRVFFAIVFAFLLASPLTARLTRTIFNPY